MTPTFTVFTPTYNRAYILPKLYESLCAQTHKDFEWLIVDDGSTDETEALILLWQKNVNGFEICYTKKENGGKPRAINTGVVLARGEYFFMVDSDDYLKPDAVEKMAKWVEEIKECENFIGVGAAKGYPDGTYLKGMPPMVNEDGFVDATNLERNLYNLDADMCEAYRTEIFRKFPMAEWPGEKFAPEQIALNEIALAGYKLRWHPDIVYICDYLEDGLTKGSRQLEKNNPMGYAMMYNHMLRYGYGPKRKFRCACQAIALAVYGKHPEYLLQMNSKWYVLLALPFGLVLAVRRALQFRKV
ncbi:MAG: glycosyltransferase [Clostridia bacterium]|nr:glycosyltransferase [Clostridia bacterium]